MSTTATSVGFRPSRFVLDNGLTVLHLETPSPAVTISFRFAAGAAFESADTQGLAGFCASMLKRGTARRTKLQIGEHLDFTGALLSAGAARHTSHLGAKSRVADFETTLALVAECVRVPEFPPAEVEKLRGDLITAINEDRDDTRQIVTDLLRAAIYPADHPYAWRLLGTEDSIAGIARDDLVAFHRGRYEPGTGVLVVVGGVEEERARKAIEKELSGWSAGTDVQGGLPAALPRIPDAEGPSERVYAIRTMTNKAQADIAVGHPGIRRLDDDYYAALVMNMILGSFAMGGRLGFTIREEKGMAYYVYSSLGTGVGPGPFMVRAGVHPDNVDGAVAAALDEMDRMRREPVSDQELADAKSALIRSLPRNLERNEGKASALHSIEQYRLGLDYLDRFADLIDAIGIDDVHAVAERRLHPDRCAIAVAGPYEREAAGGD